MTWDVIGLCDDTRLKRLHAAVELHQNRDRGLSNLVLNTI